MLKSFFSTTAIAFALSLSPIIVLADTAPQATTHTISPEKIALITELRNLTHRDDNATQVLDLMMSQMKEQGKSMGAGLFGDNPDPAVTQSFNDTFTRITDRMYELMQKKIDFVAVQREIDFKLYDEYFTEPELKDLIVFYKTPTGQKTAENYPKLTQRSMELFGEQLTPVMIEIQQQVLTEEFSSGFGMNSEPENLPEDQPMNVEESNKMPGENAQEPPKPLSTETEQANPAPM